MRILYIANSRIPTEKAHGLQIIKTIEAFQLKEIEVELLLPRRKNHIKDDIVKYYNLKTSINIKYINNYFGWLENYLHNIYFSLQRISFGIGAFFYALQSSVEIIYSREITICFFLSLFKKNVIFEDHEPKKRFRWLYKIFIKKIKKKVIVAHNLIDLYNNFNIKENSYIFTSQGVDLEEFQQVKKDRDVWQKEFNFNKEDKIILYVGHFYKWKGIYTLLDAAPTIKGKVVLIGGIKQDQDKIKKYINEHGLKNAYLHEFVSHEEIIKYIKSADVLVLPNTAKEERSAKYTTPIKLFEYMASGVPITASNLKSFSVYLQDQQNSLLCNPDDKQDLSEKINKIINNKELGKKLAIQALQEVKKYSWKKRVEKILEFIK